MTDRFVPFEVTLTPSAGGYETRYRCRPFAGQGGPYPIAPDAIDRCVQHAALLDGRGPMPAKKVAAQIGVGLFDTVLPGDAAGAFRKALRDARASGRKLRFTLEYSDEPALHEIPWELMHHGEEFCVLSADLAFARYLRQPVGESTMRVDGPLHVLHSSAGPSGLGALDFAAECREIDGQLRSHTGRVVREYVPHVGRESLRAALADGPRHVWHHSGHGDLRAELGGFVLALERAGGPDGGPDLVPVADLLAAVRGARDLRFAFLNVCKGAHAVGLATTLAKINIPAVLGYRAGVLDLTAVRFAQRVYELMLDHPIDVAVQTARHSLQASVRTLDWALPVLFLRAEDPSFFAPAGARRDLSDFTAGAAPAAAAPVAVAPAPPAEFIPMALPAGGVTVNVKLKGVKLRGGATVIGKAGTPTATEAPTEVKVDAEDVEADRLDVHGEVNVPPERLAEFLNLLKQLPQ